MLHETGWREALQLILSFIFKNEIYLSIHTVMLFICMYT